MAAPVDVFISHAAEDESLREELETHLASLKRDGIIRVWHAGQIGPGADWRSERDEHVGSARIVVVLASADYMASDSLYNEELKPTLARAAKGEVCVLGVLVRACDWEHGPLSGFPLLPRNQRPVASWQRPDEAWAEVAAGVRDAAEELSHPTPRPTDARSRLLAGIDALPNGWARTIGTFIDEYEGTAERPNPFCGREADVARVRDWIARDDAPANLVVTAPAGRGKSALIVRVAMKLATREDVAVAFVPLSARHETNRRDVFMGCLAARLAFLHGRPAPDLEHAAGDAVLGMVTDHLGQALSGGRRLVVLLDGLDEAADWHLRRGILPVRHPAAVRLIVSARARADDTWGARLREELGWDRDDDADVITLPPLEEADVAQVLKAQEPRLGAVVSAPQVVSDATRLCKGEPLTLWLLLKDLKTPGDLLDLASRKPGLDAWFKTWWERESARLGAPGRVQAARAFRNLLAVARSPLTREDVLTLANREIPDTDVLVDDVVPAVSLIVHGDGKASGYVLAHPGIAEYLCDRLAERERAQWRDRLLAWGDKVAAELASGQRAPRDVPCYVLERRPGQLREAAPIAAWMGIVTPAWYEAWQAHGAGATAFLDGVDQAWDAIAAMRGEAGLPEETTCALVRATLGSIATNVDAELLKEILENGLWTPEQALAYVRTVPLKLYGGDHGRGKLLLVIAPYARSELLPRLFDVACNLWDKPFESGLDAMKDLLPRMSTEAQQGALVALPRSVPEQARAAALAHLAPHLDVSLHAQVAEEIRRHAPLLQHPAVRADALRAVIDMVSEGERGRALDEALAAARSLTEPGCRHGAIERLLPRIPALGEEAIEVALAANDLHRAHLLAELARKLPEPARTKAVARYEATIASAQAPREIGHRWRTLLEIAPAEREENVARALRAVEAIPDSLGRADALMVLFQQESDAAGAWRTLAAEPALPILTNLEPPLLRLQVLRQIPGVFLRRDVQRIVEQMWPDIEAGVRGDDWHAWEAVPLSVVPVDKALALARSVQAPSLQAQWLARIAPVLLQEAREDVVREALDAVSRMATPKLRANVLQDLLFAAATPEQFETVGRVLDETIDSIDDPYWRAQMWLDVARLYDEPEVAPDVLDAAHDAVIEIDVPHLRLDHLLGLAKRATGERREAWFTEAVEEARPPVEHTPRARRLREVARHAEPSLRRELVREALRATSELNDERARTDTMISYAADLPLDEIDLVAADIERLWGPGGRASRYATLLHRCPEARGRLFDRAIASASVIEGAGERGEATRARAITSLVGLAPAADQEALIGEALAAAANDLAAAPWPPDATLAEDEYAIDPRTGEVARMTSSVLVQLSPALSEARRAEALDIARRIGSPVERAEAMVNLAAYLGAPERERVADEILAIRRPASWRFDFEPTRRQLAQLAVQLLPLERGMEVENDLPKVPGEPPWLWPGLPDDELFGRIERRITPPHGQPAPAPATVVPVLLALPTHRREPLVRRVVGPLANVPPALRVQVLGALLPVLPGTCADAYLDAAKVTGPSALDLPALAVVAPRLDEQRLDRILDLVDLDSSSSSPHDARLHAFAVLGAARLGRPAPPREKLTGTLRAVLRKRSDTRAHLLAVLSDVQPLMVALGGRAATVGVVRAIRQVGAWWS